MAFTSLASPSTYKFGLEAIEDEISVLLYTRQVAGQRHSLGQQRGSWGLFHLALGLRLPIMLVPVMLCQQNMVSTSFGQSVRQLSLGV